MKATDLLQLCNESSTIVYITDGKNFVVRHNEYKKGFFEYTVEDMKGNVLSMYRKPNSLPFAKKKADELDKRLEMEKSHD